MSTRIILATLALFLTAQAHASKIIGNGGNVVVCEQQPSSLSGKDDRRLQLLDFYEAEKLHSLTLADPGGIHYQDKVANLLAKLARRFPQLADEIGKEFRNFEDRKGLIPDVVLEDTVDSYHAVLPRECHIEQIAIQRPPMFPRDPWFIISRDLWDHLDELNKAGLAMHESLYRIGVRNGAEHSRGVRYLIGLMFSTDFLKISDQDWISGMLESRVRNYELEGAVIPLFTGKFDACDPLPGDTTCDKNESLRPANIIYDDQGMLRQITYDTDTRIEVVDQFSTVAHFVVSRLDITRQPSPPSTVLISANGVAEFVTDSMTNGIDPVSLVFKGVITPAFGHFEGQVSVYDYKKEPASPMHNTAGSFFRIMKDASDAYKAKQGLDDVVNTPLRLQ